MDWSYKFRNRSIISGFPGGSAVKNPPAMQETRVPSLGWEDPLEKGMATPTPVFLPGEFPQAEEPGGLLLSLLVMPPSQG